MLTDRLTLRRRWATSGRPTVSVSIARRWSTLRLFAAIQLAAAVPIITVGVVIDERNQHQETAETLRDARTHAQTLSDLVIAPHLLDQDLRQGDPATAQAALSAVLSDPDVRDQTDRITVWDLSGRVLASDDPSLVGTSSGPDEDRDAAAAGTATADIADVHIITAAGRAELVRVVDVVAPLRTVTDRSTTTGVVELYLPYEELASDLEQASADLRRDLTIALAVLLAALAGLTWPLLRRLARQVEAIERAAITDALTGLANRAGLEAELAAQAAAGRGGVLVLADVSDLHQINEAVGRLGGDELLRALATRLQGLAGVSRVARTGGGEFAVLLPALDAVDAADATQVRSVTRVLHAPQAPGVDAGVIDSGRDADGVLRSMREQLAHPLEVAGVPITPVLALGAAEWRDQRTDISASVDAESSLEAWTSRTQVTSATTAVHRAEAALQVARRRTCGTAVWDPCSDTFDAARLRLLTELRMAVPAGQLRLHYQPQVHARTGETASYEALVRWEHPERGLLGPGDFLPMAERTGLVTTLTDWVVAEAARQQAAWARTGLRTAVSVNISARDLADPGFATRTLNAVHAAGAEIAMVRLELTETALVEDPTGARSLLTDLAGAGFWLSLDDFGQGATSLAQLSDLPLHELKLDRAFVAGMDRSSADAAIVSSVVHLAHNLGLVVVAEGVETEAQASALAAAGYDVLQGWYYGRPVPPDQVEGAIPQSVPTQRQGALP